MPKLPVFLDVAGRRAVIVGGGAVAARKAAVLARAGAKIVVIAPELHSELRTMVEDGSVEWFEKKFERGDLPEALLVFAATNLASVNREVELEARTKNQLVSLADESGDSDFQLGAAIERGDITVSVATGGRSPALSRLVRDRIEQALTPQLARLAEILGDLRESAKRDLATDAERKRFFDAILQSDIEVLLCSDDSAAERRLAAICRDFGVKLVASS